MIYYIFGRRVKMKCGSQFFFFVLSGKIRSLSPHSIIIYGFLSCLLSIKSQKDNNNNKKRIKKAEQREPNRVYIARRHSPRERNVNDTDQRMWRSCVHGRVERYYSIVATTAARDIPFSCYDYLFRSWTVKKSSSDEDQTNTHAMHKVIKNRQNYYKKKIRIYTAAQ